MTIFLLLDLEFLLSQKNAALQNIYSVFVTFSEMPFSKFLCLRVKVILFTTNFAQAVTVMSHRMFRFLAFTGLVLLTDPV